MANSGHELPAPRFNAERNERLDAFYGSDEWRQRHRDGVLALLEGYHVLLLPALPMRDALAG